MVSACGALLVLHSMRVGGSTVTGGIVGGHGPWPICFIKQFACCKSSIAGRGRIAGVWWDVDCDLGPWSTC